MKPILKVSLIMVIALAFLAGQLGAANSSVKPPRFPSGPHYSLNIIGKKDGFTCPAQEYDTSKNPVYGDVIFVPENGIGSQIYLQSGNSTHATAVSELQAIDPCAGFDGNAAVIQLPPNDKGYRVYARALARPINTVNIAILPKLIAVEDEEGNDLIYLGLVTNNGLTTVDGITISQPKGESPTLNITGLFKWTGDVCYLKPPDDSYQTSQICCLDQVEACDLPKTQDRTTCPTVGYQSITTYCKEYTDAWVLNIGDFVDYLWSADHNGMKMLQVRFYPN